MSDDTKGFKEIGEVLETDQGMATRVLKIANSAYYGLSIPVSSVQQASALLGCQSLLELITVVSTSKIMGKALDGYGFSSENVWKHSLSVATCSKNIADLKFPAFSNDAFNAGLIHDSGMIILDEYVVERKEMFKNISDDETSLINAEKKAFGFDHAEIASEFFQKWKLPKTQTYAIKYHHKPSESNGDTLSYILHAADCIVRYGPEYSNIVSNAENGVFNHLKLNEEEIAKIFSTTMEAVDNIITSISS
jgi:HD-like signal output (HDOD) protein